MSLSLGSPPQPPSPAKLPSRTRCALWQVAPLFPSRTDPSYGAAHGGAAHRQSAHGLYVVATLLKSEVGMCSWRSALRSLLAFCSSFGRDPGLFFGAKDSPWSAFFT